MGEEPQEKRRRSGGQRGRSELATDERYWAPEGVLCICPACERNDFVKPTGVNATQVRRHNRAMQFIQNTLRDISLSIILKCMKALISKLMLIKDT